MSKSSTKLPFTCSEAQLSTATYFISRTSFPSHNSVATEIITTIMNRQAVMDLCSVSATAAKRAMHFLLLIALFVVVLSDGEGPTRGAKFAGPKVSAAVNSLNLQLPSDIPDALCNFTGGKGQFSDFLVDLFIGVGYQEYTYNGTGWVNTNVSAVLYDNNEKEVAHHFFIPPPGKDGAMATWEKIDPSSRVTALPAVKIPQQGGVPLLLLESKFNSGKASGFGQVTNVQRLSTRDGLPPNPANATTGEIFVSPYSALYAFYNVT